MSNFEERIKKLSARQKLLLAKQISAEDKLKTSGQSSFQQSIVAYLVADEQIDKNDLRNGLRDKLPEYMIPFKFVQVDEMPTLPNGKIDANLLNLPVEEESSFSKTGVSTPKTEVEKHLVEIWEEVLGFRPIGVHDNFFEIGGDSILSIQIVAKARQKGIYLAPNKMFEHQTISELALFAKAENDNTSEATILGTTPLLPVHHLFFEKQKKALHYWNQAIVFDVPENLNQDVLKRSIDYLITHHDVLRLGFEKTEDGWNAFVAAPATTHAFTSINLADLSPSEMDATIKERAIELQVNQDRYKSGLFQALFFRCGSGRRDKMLLIAPHLLIDSSSWQILVSNLESIYGQLSKDEEITLPPKTTSYQRWGNHLAELSKSGEFDDEIEFWKEQNACEQVPIDLDSQFPIDEKTGKILALEIDLAATENLVRNTNETYHTTTEELLITALMVAFEKWTNKTSLCLGLERQIRNYNKLDLSNSVGWFATHFPVSLKIKDGTDFKSSIISIKEQLRRIPNDGIGFGVLRYLKKIDGLTQNPQVSFRFSVHQKPFNSKVLGRGEFIARGIRSEKTERYHLLEIDSFIEEGCLKLEFSFSDKVHKPETIQDLIGHFETALRSLIEHCSSQETNKYSPSDFPEADLNQSDLDNLLKQIN
ncbi:hypothetical protein HRG84_07485 [Flavisolibacter sp. BT320]|nr:hypothetical protein [Flavisolibacter longurius]